MPWGKQRKVQNVFCSNTKIDKDDNESVATISYKIKFIDSTSFMAS